MNTIRFKNENVAISCDDEKYVLHTIDGYILAESKIDSDDRFDFVKHCYNAGVSEVFLVHVINKRRF